MSARLRSSTRASTAASTAASESLAETVSETKAKSERRTTGARPIRGNELARLTRIAMVAYLTSLTIIGAAIYLLMNDKVRLYPSTIKLESLKGFSSRAEYALRYQTLLYSWLVFNVYSVIYVRITKKALNPLVDSTEKHLHQYKNILTNSFEGIISSSFLQLIFVSFADHAYTLKLIPAVNILQFIGRIAFFAGYPLYRTFGVSLTLTPNLLMTGFNLFKLGSYLGLY